MLTIRPVKLSDAKAIQSIYAPYVEKTAITFEYEVPSVQEFENRINKTLEIILIWSLKRMGKFWDMPMLQPTMPGQLIIGQLNCPSICTKMPVVEVWEANFTMPLKKS